MGDTSLRRAEEQPIDDSPCDGIAFCPFGRLPLAATLLRFMRNNKYTIINKNAIQSPSSSSPHKHTDHRHGVLRTKAYTKLDLRAYFVASRSSPASTLSQFSRICGINYLFAFLFLLPFFRGRTMWFSIHERIFEPNIAAYRWWCCCCCFRRRCCYFWCVLVVSGFRLSTFGRIRTYYNAAHRRDASLELWWCDGDDDNDTV